MKKYSLLTFLFLFIFIGGIGGRLFYHYVSSDIQKEKTALLEVFPTAKQFSKKFSHPPHYKAYTFDTRTGKRKLLGIAFVTTDLAPEFRGYAGPIKIMVGLTPEGKICGISLIAHTETPSYVVGLQAFLHQFLSLGKDSSFVLGKDIDAISRATITSEAITRSIKKGVKKICHDVLDIPTTKTKKAHTSIPLSQIIIPSLLFLCAILALILKKDSLRWVSLISGFLYLGIFQATMLSTVQIINAGLGKLPEITRLPLWYMLLGLNLITLLFIGNIYCGSICPFAIIEEVLYKIFHRKPSLETSSISSALDKKLRYGKYFILLIVTAISFLVGKADAANIEVFTTLFTWKGSSLAWGLLRFTLLASLFYYRFWCKYLCPMGAFNGLISRFSLFKIIVRDSCEKCEHCKKVCPTEAIFTDSEKKPIIDYAECILCGKCIQECPSGSLKLQQCHEKR